MAGGDEGDDLGDALGADVGSTTAKVAVVDGRGRLLWGRVRRHRGRPLETVERLVAEARAAHDVARAGVTGSIGTSLCDRLGALPVHEVQAVTARVREVLPATRSIVELGGQDAKLVLLGRPGEEDMQLNDRCAAGTGATIDRVVRRLGLDESALASAELEGDLRVAAKCGVFAETDLVALVKAGAGPRAALAALLRAIVVQNLAVLARGRTLRPPVVLLGGPHAHLPALATAWREALEILWRERGVTTGEVVVPAHAALFAAMGAAAHAAREGRPMPRVGGVLGKPRVLGPLVRPGERALLDALRPAPAPPRPRAGPLRGHLGIDAGSTTSKAVLVDDDGRVLLSSYGPSRGNPVDDARARLAELERAAREVGAALEIASLGTTGYGLELVGPAFGADAAPVETVAAAAAARLASPSADVVVDVGGTDTKVLCLEGARIRSFHVSNQCSAGHGAFLASVAQDLGVPLEHYAARALRAPSAPRFTVGCAVFMDTDRVTFQRDGWTTDAILAGLAVALARNVWELVVPEPPERLGRSFLLAGGTPRNLAVAWALARTLRERVPDAHVAVHPHPELCAAIGAALSAREARRGAAGPSRFVGLEAAARVRVEVRRGRETRCDRCEVGCERSFVQIPAPTAGDRPSRLQVLGNACERGADEASTRPRSRRHAPDLLAEEARRLFRHRGPAVPRPTRAMPVFGIPRVMGLYRSAPLLLHYLRAAGVPASHLELSPPTSTELYQEGARWGVTDPCFPAKLVLSHVDYLLGRHRARPLDVLLMPAITHAAIAVTGTADTASCPIVAACGHTSLAALSREGDLLGRLGIRPLTPALCLADPAQLDVQLFAAFGELLGLDAGTHAAALEAGLRAQRLFHARCRRRGAWVIERARAQGRAVAVVLGRPYHADPGVHHGVSTELASRGIPVMGISSLPVGSDARMDLGDLLPLATNSGCAEKAWAARLVAATRGLLAVDLSSFRCGQDASILGLLSALLGDAGKPALRLHDLDEDRPAATLRLRIETFVDAARRYERDALRRPEPPAHEARP